MKITVTQRHIERGEKHAASRCPVALALEDAKPSSYARVCPFNNIFETRTIRGVLTRYDIPATVRIFVRAFDQGLPVEPFTFTLRKRKA
jgi:hypothetical protein